MQRLEEKKDLNHSSLTQSLANTNLDRVLFNDLVQIVPLVHSLIVTDKKASSSFARRGSMIYTKAPSREELLERMTYLKARSIGQSFPAKKKKDHGEKRQVKEECFLVKEQVEELQMKLLEKDELLKSAENSRNQMSAIKEKLDELKHLASQKDSLLKSTQQQLFDVKMMLADKQAALEKIQWEAMISNKKEEKIQEEIDSISMQGDLSSFTLLLEGLKITDTAVYTDDYDIKPYDFNHLPSIDKLDEMEMHKIEDARKAYNVAVASAKEKQDEESIAAAASARFNLQSILFKTGNSSL